MENISQLTKLSYQYGPFLFALLFNLVISRWGYKIYNRAIQRKDPKATEQELKTYRGYFLGTAIFGVILVIISIIWWFITQTSVHVFTGKIVSLKEYEKVTSSTLFFRPVFVAKLEENIPQIRDENFLFIQNKPFTTEQKFKIYYNKGEGRLEEFSINYVPEIIPEYCIEWDEDSGKNIIKHLNPSSLSFSLIPSLFAQDFNNESNQEDSDIDDPYMIYLLQEERTDVGQKIQILDKLNNLDDNTLKRYITFSSSKEKMILTLLDLSRHTDKELAYKAKRLINQRFDLEKYLIDNLLSGYTKRMTAEKILFRIEKERALKILQQIPNKNSYPWINELENKIQSGNYTKVLIPTGSSKGDRYYVKAEWDPQNSEVVSCLTILFHRELIHNRTIEEEVELMKRRKGNRFVYWYSKGWAMYIAKKIENCGANASFVGIK